MDHLLYKTLYEEKKTWYKTIGKVYCPCLGTDIVFNSKGFHHLKFDGSGERRSIRNQVIRLNLLPLVIPLIKQATSIHEYRLSTDKKTQSWALEGNINGNTIYFSVMIAE